MSHLQSRQALRQPASLGCVLGNIHLGSVPVCTEMFPSYKKDWRLCFSNGRGDRVRVSRAVPPVVPAGQRADGRRPARLAHQRREDPQLFFSLSVDSSSVTISVAIRKKTLVSKPNQWDDFDLYEEM